MLNMFVEILFCRLPCVFSIFPALFINFGCISQFIKQINEFSFIFRQKPFLKISIIKLKVDMNKNKEEVKLVVHS